MTHRNINHHRLHTFGVFGSNHWLPATPHPPPATRDPPPATRHPPPATRHPPPATRHPPTANRQPPPANRHPTPATRYPPRHPLPATRHPPPVISKLIERVGAKHPTVYLQGINSFQSAYRQDHSTETALIKVHNEILCAVDHGCVVVLVMRDPTVAFGTIDRAILVSTLTDSGSQALRLSDSDRTCPVATN